MEMYRDKNGIRVDVNAKINLSLAITGKRGNMHQIDSIVAPISLFDTVTVKPKKKGGSAIFYSDGAEYKKDNVLKSVKLIEDYFNTDPVDIYVERNVPGGRGFGGSSIASAGAIFAVKELYGLPSIPQSLLTLAGGDVPVLYKGMPSRVRGQGEQLEDIIIPDNISIVTVIPKNLTVASGDAYALFDKIKGDNGNIDEFLTDFTQPFNALQKSAETIIPKLKNIHQMLIDCGLTNVVMTGSGSAYIGYTFDDELMTKAIKKLSSSVAYHDLDFTTKRLEVAKGRYNG